MSHQPQPQQVKQSNLADPTDSPTYMLVETPQSLHTRAQHLHTCTQQGAGFTPSTTYPDLTCRASCAFPAALRLRCRLSTTTLHHGRDPSTCTSADRQTGRQKAGSKAPKRPPSTCVFAETASNRGAIRFAADSPRTTACPICPAAQCRLDDVICIARRHTVSQGCSTSQWVCVQEAYTYLHNKGGTAETQLPDSKKHGAKMAPRDPWPCLRETRCISATYLSTPPRKL